MQLDKHLAVSKEQDSRFLYSTHTVADSDSRRTRAVNSTVSIISQVVKKLHLGIKVISKQHPKVGLSLKIYLGHVKVTSCAMTGFVCS